MGKNPEKIILIGYRATGKTTVGRELARHQGLPFVDTDAVLKERHGEISRLVEERGWEFFRKQEAELLSELAAGETGVIATGGGAVLNGNSWRQLADSGFVIWLTADLATICRRLGQDPASGRQRPSLTGGTILAEAAAVLAEREPLYRESADLMVDGGLTAAEVVGRIEEDLKKTY